jgi:hypothetical protein
MMHDKAAVIEHICQAFGGNAFPGAGSLQGRFDGCEPYEAVYPFQIADPMFHLTHGFAETAVQVPTPGRVLVLRHGQSAFINPRRYGAATWYDYARYRQSVFTREEAGAIVAYLECRREADPDKMDHAAIEAALQSFWQERAQTAPVAASLQQYLAEHEAYPVAMRTAGQEHQGAS